MNLLDWYKWLGTHQPSLHTTIADGLSPLFGGLWVFLCVGDWRRVVSHVQAHIAPLAAAAEATFPTASALAFAMSTPSGRLSLGLEPSEAALARTSLLFVPDRWWPGWLVLQEEAWRMLLKVGGLLWSHHDRLCGQAQLHMQPAMCPLQC